ncbi:MAG: TrmH family RNA methyltransferase [Minisyncoccia bacterium]
MLTKNQIKLIKSLHEKKNRQELGLFLVEGAKSVAELLSSDFKIEHLLVTDDFYGKNLDLIRPLTEIKGVPFEIITQEDLEKLSTLESNNAALAVVKQKENTAPVIKDDEIVIVLDDVRDPGNLGTIIRIADWYGVKNIIVSKNTADFYNSKTISASMGSFIRANIFYTDLADFLSKTKLPILGALMSGENVHTFKFPKSGILVMGNESNGVSAEIEKLITDKITIPRFGQAESLNVSIATAVIMDNWKK